VKTRRPIGVSLIAIATLYLVAALLMGFFMGVSEDHSLVSVHSHLGLLGWATMAITGIVYLLLPACARSRLAPAHFWLHNVGLPIMMIGLAVVAQFGDARAEPAIGVGSLLVVAALIVFCVNLLRNGRTEPAPRPQSPDFNAA